jgi:hypothetical protein
MCDSSKIQGPELSALLTVACINDGQLVLLIFLGLRDLSKFINYRREHLGVNTVYFKRQPHCTQARYLNIKSTSNVEVTSQRQVEVTAE